MAEKNRRVGHIPEQALRVPLLYRYIFFEMLGPFLVSILFFTFIFVMTQILQITDLVVNYRVGLFDVARVIGYSMPFFLQFVIPMSVMLTTLLTFLRMSADNEIIALKNAGIGVFRLLPPVFAFGLFASLLTAFMTFYGMPRGRLATKSLLIEIVSSNIEIGLKERTFNDRFDKVMLYVNRIDPKDKSLSGIFIEDRRIGSTTIVAGYGLLAREKDRPVFHLLLKNGTIHRVDLAGRKADLIRFADYDMKLDLKGTIKGLKNAGPKDEEEMSLAELVRYIDSRKIKDDRYYLALMELHKKFSLPVACLVLVMVAVPLGMTSRSARKSFGIGLGILFFLFYYMMLSAGWVFGEAGKYPPAIGMWVPDVVTGLLGVFMLWRCADEKPLVFIPFSLVRRLFERGGQAR